MVAGKDTMQTSGVISCFLFHDTHMYCVQTPEKGDAEPVLDTTGELPDSSSSNSRNCGGGTEGDGLSTEQPFIKLSQEEYGEHHSSIMHCRSAFSLTFLEDELTLDHHIRDHLICPSFFCSPELTVLVVGLPVWM